MKLLDKILAMPHGDKIAHALGGGVVGLVAVAAGFPQFAIPAAGVGGAVKEGYDKFSGKGTVDVLDFAATLVGGVVVQLVYFLTLNNFVG